MSDTTHPRPDDTEYASFYAGYVASVPDGDIVDVLRAGGAALGAALPAIPQARAGYRYAEGKWSVCEVIGHMIDAERIFTYRILRIARGDQTPLASFDQDEYVRTAGSDARTIAGLAAEMVALRASTLLLLESLPAASWSNRGTASEKPVSVRALAYITAGHAQHHLNVLHERYGA